MAKIRFRRPKIAVLMSEIVSVTVWLYLGDQIIDVLDGLVGNTYGLNYSGIGATATPTSQGGCVNSTVFEDAYTILGIGSDCAPYVTNTTLIGTLSNTDDGLLGVIGLVMVVMILMNFITYN